MDEILSSIRQIIADDDEAAARKTAVPPAPRPVAAASPASSAFDTFVDPFADDEDDAVPPLALTPEQIVRDPDPQEEPAPQTPVSAPAREMRAASVRPAAATAAASAPHPPAAAQEEPADEGLSPSLDDDVAFAVPPERPEPPVRPRPSAAQSAPLPDPALTSDLTEQLLDPASAAAINSAFARLSTPKLRPESSIGGLTVEAMLRDMLRPMLKDWLDENLPALVERLVEQEIERAARGGR